MKLSSMVKFLAFAAVAALAGSAARAEEPPKAKAAQLGLYEVSVGKTLASVAAKTNATESVGHFTDSLNEHMVVALKNTNKFDIIARADLSKLIDEQQLPKGLIVDPTQAKALPGRVKALDYLVVPVLTDFVDSQETVVVPGMNMRVDRRTVRATLIVKIYNTTTGSMLEAIAVPASVDEAGTKRIARVGGNNGARDDGMIEAVVDQICGSAAGRVVDRLYPAKVIGFTSPQVTINRGEGTGVAAGQTWDIYALGNEMKDPDTNEVLGREEVKVGELVVTDVLTKFSKGQLRGNNTGVEVGAIVRPRLAPPPPPPGMDPAGGPGMQPPMQDPNGPMPQPR